jgi:hypothetical protein
MAHGDLWQSADDENLIKWFDEGVSVQEIANRLNRTLGATLTRLYRPGGRIYPQDNMWWIPRKPLISFSDVKLQNEAYHLRLDRS